MTHKLTPTLTCFECFVADTTFMLKEGSKNTFYAYDDPDRLFCHCRIMQIVEDAAASPDQCQFRLLHLSSDLGDMNCFFILENESRVFPANLPVNIKMAHTPILLPLMKV